MTFETILQNAINDLREPDSTDSEEIAAFAMKQGELAGSMMNQIQASTAFMSSLKPFSVVTKL